MAAGDGPFQSGVPIPWWLGLWVRGSKIPVVRPYRSMFHAWPAVPLSVNSKISASSCSCRPLRSSVHVGPIRAFGHCDTDTVLEVAKNPLNRSALVVEFLSPRRRARHEGVHRSAVRRVSVVSVRRTDTVRPLLQGASVGACREGGAAEERAILPFRSTNRPLTAL